MEYRENDFFNENDTYVFVNSLGQKIVSKVHKDEDKPHWYTNEKPHYKCTSLMCRIF